MALLGELQVNLVANSKKLVAGFKKATKVTKSFVQKHRKAMAKYASFGIGAATAVVGTFARAQLKMIDDLGKTSRRLGITTEALGAYRHAAMLSGLESATLTTALEKMRDVLGDALLGGGESIDAFEQIGLDAEKLSKLEDPLAAIQKSIEGIADQNKKLAAVRDIFGRGGAQVLNLFEQDLAGVRKEYEKLGLAVSSADAKKIEDLNDSMAVVGEKLKGVGRNILIDVSDQALDAVKGLEIILQEAGIITKPGSAKSGGESLGEQWKSFTDFVGRTYTGGSLTSDASLSQRFTNQLTNQEIMKRQVRIMEQTRDAIRAQQQEPALLN